MTLRDDLVARLEQENEVLRARVRMLEEMAGARFEIPPQFDLKLAEATIFGALLNNQLVSRQNLLTLIYGLHPQDEPEIKIIDVWICKIRRKMKPYGIEIGTIWGKGFFMPTASKAVVNRLLMDLAA